MIAAGPDSREPPFQGDCQTTVADKKSGAPAPVKSVFKNHLTFKQLKASLVTAC
jgi:hypothetical protein